MRLAIGNIKEALARNAQAEKKGQGRLQACLMAMLLFAVMVPSLVSVVKQTFGQYAWIHSGYYFVGYETGFGGRKLLGTICNQLIFTPPHTYSTEQLSDNPSGSSVAGMVAGGAGHVGHKQMLPLLWGALAVCAGLFVTLMAWCLSRCPTVGLVMCLVYFIAPFNLANFFTEGVFVRYIDGWLYLLYMLFLLLFVVCRRRRWGYYVAAAVALYAAVLTHQLFCCLLFPAVLMLMVTDSVRADGIDWKRALPNGVIVLLMVALLGVIVFCEQMNVDAYTLYDSICQRTSPGVFSRNFRHFHLVFFTDTVGNIQAQWGRGNLQLHWAMFLPNILLLSPALLVLAWPWVSAARAGKSRWEKWRYGLALAVHGVATLPMFIVAIDYGRWFYAMFFGLFTATAVMLGTGDEGLKAAWDRMLAWGKKHPYLAVLVVLYLASLKPSCETASPEILAVAYSLFGL